MTPLTTLAGALVNNENNNHRGLIVLSDIPKNNQCCGGRFRMNIPCKKAGLVRWCVPLLFFSATLQAEHPKIAVGQNIQVSIAHAQENHGETLGTTDPSDPNRLVGCSMIFPDPLQRRWSDDATH